MADLPKWLQRHFPGTSITLKSTAFVLTMLTLLLASILDTYALYRLIAPPAPLAGSWEGVVEGNAAVFCFEQHGPVVFGEFVFDGAATVAVDGAARGNFFELSYFRNKNFADPELRLDSGVLNLFYEKKNKEHGETLQGYWRSRKAETDGASTSDVTRNRTQELVYMTRKSKKCTLSLWSYDAKAEA